MIGPVAWKIRVFIGMNNKVDIISYYSQLYTFVRVSGFHDQAIRKNMQLNLILFLSPYTWTVQSILCLTIFNYQLTISLHFTGLCREC